MASSQPPLSRRVRMLVPLLEALRTMKPAHRIIVLSHLSSTAQDHLYATIAKVLTSKRVPDKKRGQLKKKLEPYKKLLRKLADRSSSVRTKKRLLPQIGAGPLTHVLSTAVPLILQTFD